MPKEVKIGLVGYKFMGKAHSHAYRNAPIFFPMKAKPVMRAICGRDKRGVRAAAEKYGWESCETSWEKLVERDDIDLIDICTPVNLHKDIAVAAARWGKHILCEKPMAISLEEAEKMLKEAEKASVKHMMGFNYRRIPAVLLAKKIIDEGMVGGIYHFRAHYLQDWIIDPNFPLTWRLQKETAGSGALGDIGAHIFDLARFLVGEIDSVVSMTETFIKKRPQKNSSGTGTEKKMRKVTVDDAAVAMVRFKNNALGNFEASRMCAGRKNYQWFEVNGTRGSLYFNLERLNELKFFSREDDTQGFKTILVTEKHHPYIHAWWPPGHTLGWEHAMIHQIYELMQSIEHNTTPSPGFKDGVENQRILEAVARSAKRKEWVKVR